MDAPTLPTPDPQPADEQRVVRLDRHTLSIDGAVTVTAREETERRVRALTDEQLTRLKVIMGGRA